MQTAALEISPWENAPALNVFRALDPSDFREAELIRGGGDYLDLFADWKVAQQGAVLSLLVKWRGRTFAVLALGNTGQSGVAQAALLARDHQRHRLALAHAGRQIRKLLPETCADLGIHRVEARSWAGHPTAASFLSLCGFTHETDMPGFGPAATEVFRQFAWTAQQKAKRHV